ncbi:putative serine/threonine protein kinase [Actinoplanes missouriensis 431]|uniref:Putative serine/threonine protein kinase n=1 Tax=Actinoplanes missouriensis (strain ATCC 14538 / DSM 43046 / CBS 188.64 / JCM 3121 / NBRC 102363 / NCIMB 12654 / NRRL B-3342 / UNCC 431) TaxID=512565 RepID=I0HBH1_ACTM4|nr:serine/threonine-protein kinase [Actinoplanes missouriensis]BAL90358.1 putative serine/threonine protein kinase [Actinoplanes missouriensis 431]
MSMPLRPQDATRLGRYELVGRLGEGGMGTVFLGRDPDGRPVAIKTVRPEYAAEAEFRGRFRSEVNRAQQVPPFSTAEVLDADPDHEPPYLVVEYVDGPSLAAEIRDRGPLTGAALQSVAVGVATALTAIHGAGVIHRDLKPGNVLFARGGIKVIDFGIARAFEATSQHTRTDQMVGTVAYMAPERFDPAGGRPVTAAADIFAWGAVVVYTATGRTPFAAESAAATAMRILTQQPDLTGVPEALVPVVERALAKDPVERPSARELLDLLLASSSAGAPSAPPSVPSSAVSSPSAFSSVPLSAASSSSASRSSSGGSPFSGGAAAAGAGAFGAGQDAAASSFSGGLATAPGDDRLVAPRQADTAHQAVAPRRSRRRVAVGLGVVAVVLAGGVGAGVRYLADGPVADVASDAASPQPGEITSSGAANPGAASPGDSAPAEPEPATAAEKLAAILRGNRQTLIHVAEINRDLALEKNDYEVLAGDGTGAKSLFALESLGVDYMIRSMGDPADDRCIGVKIIPDKDSQLVPAECNATKATVFSLIKTKETDDQGRPTYWIYNDSYGYVQWNPDTEALFVEEVGDAYPLSTFSFVDRGPVPS